jgi:hypothetical protein
MQVAWVTCHSDCQEGLVPLWQLSRHDCHDEASGDHHDHCAPGDHDHRTTQAHRGCHVGEGLCHDHGRGDHEILASQSSIPDTSRGRDLLSDVGAAVPVEGAAPGGRGPAHDLAPAAWEGSGAGPPDRVATTRLLL